MPQNQWCSATWPGDPGPPDPPGLIGDWFRAVPCPLSGAADRVKLNGKGKAYNMNDRAKLLSDEARKLTPAERLQVVDEILSSLDEPDNSLDLLWAKEVEDRLRAYRRGELGAVDLDEVLEKYRTE